MSRLPLVRALVAACVLCVMDAGAAAAQGHVHPSPSAPDSVSLPALLAQVAEANPMLRAARHRVAALAARSAQASTLPDPTVGLTYQPFPLLTARGAQRTQWRVEQTVPYPGKRALQGEVATLEAGVAAREADVLAADLALQVKEAYYELYRLQETARLLTDFQATLRDFEEAAAVRYEVGQGMQQAVLKAQLEKHELGRRLLDLQAQRRRAAEVLARLTDHTDLGPFLAGLPAPPLPDLPPADSLRAVAHRFHPELAALEAAVEQAERRVALARKQYLPDVTFHLTYFDLAERAMPATADGRDALALGASVKIPLQRERLRAGVAEARARVAEAEARLDAHHTAVTTRVEALLFGLAQETATLDLYRRTLLPQAASTVEATVSAYTTGRTGFLDLLDAQRMQFTLRTGYLDAYTRALKAAAGLERLLGVVSLEALAPAPSSFDLR